MSDNTLYRWIRKKGPCDSFYRVLKEKDMQHHRGRSNKPGAKPISTHLLSNRKIFAWFRKKNLRYPAQKDMQNNPATSIDKDKHLRAIVFQANPRV